MFSTLKVGFLTRALVSVLLFFCAITQVRAEGTSSRLSSGSQCRLGLEFIEKYRSDGSNEETTSLNDLLDRQNPILFGEEYETSFFKFLANAGMSLEQFNGEVAKTSQAQRLRFAEQLWLQWSADTGGHTDLDETFEAAAKITREAKSGSVARAINISRSIEEIGHHPSLKNQVIQIIANSLLDYGTFLEWRQQIAAEKYYSTRSMSDARAELSKKWTSRYTSMILWGAGAVTLLDTLGAKSLGFHAPGTLGFVALTAGMPAMAFLGPDASLIALGLAAKAYHSFRARWLARHPLKVVPPSQKVATSRAAHD